MSEKLTSESLTGAQQTPLLINGRRLALDPGVARLRRYLPVLAVIAAPYAGMGGNQEPLNPLDRINEWRLLTDAFRAVGRVQPDLALARLIPPTAAQLGQALAAGGPDAFRVVHFVCHGERDMLYLEDDDGHEAYVVAEHLVRLFKTSRVNLVIMEGCFSRHTADMLIEQTDVQAVIGTRRKVTEQNAVTFNARFYAEIGRGVNIRAAFRAARGDVEGQADKYELVQEDEDYVLPLPADPAARPLIDDGQPRWIGVPQYMGFVGRREELQALASDIPAAPYRLHILRGPVGIGKSWLAAEFVGRFGWRFPDGLLWFQITAQTTAREVLVQIAALLELPPTAPLDDVLAAMRGRRFLVILDQVAAPESAKDLQQIAALIEAIDPNSRVLYITRDLPDPLAQIDDSRTYDLKPLTPKSARTLALRLAVDRGVEALDVDTIDDFLERTHNLPWLIVRGIDLIESDGIVSALEDLTTFKPDMSDPLGLYVGRRLKLLIMEFNEPPSMLVKALNLPDAFDPKLVAGLVGERASEQARVLLKYGMLRREGALYTLPPTVRAQVRQLVSPSAEDQKQTDVYLLQALARMWPADPPSLDREGQARLNNTRAVVRRQIQPDATTDRALVARLLVAAAPAFLATGLAVEFLTYAQAIRSRLAEGPDLARLQIVMGEALCQIPAKQNEAGWLFQVTASMNGIDPGTLGEAKRAYAQYLLRTGQASAAEEVLSGGLQLLLQRQDADVTLASQLAHDWGHILVSARRYEEAAARFEAALAGYTQTRRADLAVEALRDLAEARIMLGHLDRADEALRRAMSIPAECNLRPLSARLAMALGARMPRAAAEVEFKRAEQLISDEITEALASPASARLAECYLDLGRVLARSSRFDEALTSLERSRDLFTRANHPSGQIDTLITRGQMDMAQGNSVAAQAALHEALDLAALHHDAARVVQAAGVLVHVHQIRVKRARRGDRNFRQNTRREATFTREVFAGMGLDEHVAALDRIIEEISGDESKPFWY